MNRCCKVCRHWFPLETASGGTCRKAAPQHVRLMLPFPELTPAGLDQLAMKRWPIVFMADVCARFNWRCSVPGCRTPIRQFFHEREQGPYCASHAYLRDLSAA
jgi:hypothetical protein